MGKADVEKTVQTFLETFKGAADIDVRVHRTQERAFGPAGRGRGHIGAEPFPG